LNTHQKESNGCSKKDEKRETRKEKQKIDGLKRYIEKYLRFNYPPEMILKICTNIGWNKKFTQKLIEEVKSKIF
tara:strand:+ start:76 stop:297 length:222 start_codon:yes stop_codon:yes gene_type:complete